MNRKLASSIKKTRRKPGSLIGQSNKSLLHTIQKTKLTDCSLHNDQSLMNTASVAKVIIMVDKVKLHE